MHPTTHWVAGILGGTEDKNGRRRDGTASYMRVSKQTPLWEATSMPSRKQ